MACCLPGSDRGKMYAQSPDGSLPDNSDWMGNLPSVLATIPLNALAIPGRFVDVACNMFRA